MHKIVKALPCLLLIAFGAHAEAKPAVSMHAANHAPTAALVGVQSRDIAQSPLRTDGRVVAAAKKKQSKTKPAASAPAPVAKAEPHDPSNRFNMTQNGKRMTADDFDAWMKSRGYHVVKASNDAAKDSGAAAKQGSD